MKLKLKGAWLILRYGMKFDDMYPIYGKYIGNWGDASTEFSFEAVKDGKVVATKTRSPATSVRLEAVCGRTELVEADTYDVAAIRLRVVDQNGNVLPFYMGSVKLEASGAIELVGPSDATLRGGLGGTYVRTRGAGTGELSLKADGMESVIIKFDVKKTGGTI